MTTIRFPASVVITGAGSVSVAGCGLDSLRAEVAGNGVGPREVDRSAGYHLSNSARSAYLVDDTGLAPLVPAMAARRMCRPSRFAVAAAKLAIADAGASPETEHPLAVAIATSFGPSRTTEKLIRQILEEGPEAVSPALFTESVANAPAAQVALALRARGPNITITQREAGPLMALTRGAREVLSGRAKTALVGAVDEVTPLLHAILDRFGALARPRDSRVEAARPFDRNRDGAVLGEGCTILVVEPEGSAVARGARILARVVRCGRAFDPQAPPTGWSSDPGPLAQAMRSSLAAGGITPSDIDRIVCGGSGSRPGDRGEARVLCEVWQDRALPAVLVPKSYLGEHGGAILAGAVLALSGAPFGRTPGFESPDPDLSLIPYDGRGLETPRRILATSFAAGGAASWAVLEHPLR